MKIEYYKVANVRTGLLGDKVSDDFVPLRGEVIKAYIDEEEYIKVGDGKTTLKDIPMSFYNENDKIIYLLKEVLSEIKDTKKQIKYLDNKIDRLKYDNGWRQIKWSEN